MRIDCDDCRMQHTSVCDDCVVTFIVGREPGDAVIIDVEDGGFEGVDRGDLLIERGSRFDRLYVDGDYVCKVFGEFLNYDEILLL